MAGIHLPSVLFSECIMVSLYTGVIALQYLVVAAGPASLQNDAFLS